MLSSPAIESLSIDLLSGDRSVMATDMQRAQQEAPAADSEKNSRVVSVRDGPMEPEVVDELVDLLSQLSITVHNGPTISIKGVLARVRRLKVRRVIRGLVAKPRSQHPARPRIDEIPTGRRGVMIERTRRLQSLVDEHILAEKAVAADGMTGLTHEGATELANVETGAHSAMVGLEHDIVDEVMIGSDVEAEMDESSDSDDESAFIDGNCLQQEQDGPVVDSMGLVNEGPLKESSAVSFDRAPKFATCSPLSAFSSSLFLLLEWYACAGDVGGLGSLSYTTSMKPIKDEFR